MGYSLIFVRPCSGKRVPLERDPGRYLAQGGQLVQRNQHWLRRIAFGDVEICMPPAPAPDVVPHASVAEAATTAVAEQPSAVAMAQAPTRKRKSSPRGKK